MNRALLELLRSHTQPLHRHLDSHECLNVLLQPKLTEEAYIRSLQALYLPQKTLELSLMTAISLFFPGYHYPLRYPYIEKDLAQLHVQSSDVAVADLRLTSPSKTLGILYVLEGSKLGAKQISRCLSGQKLPTFFFQSAINDESCGWKSFTELTQLNSIKPDDVVNAAKQGFECFIHSLEHDQYDSLNTKLISSSFNTQG